MKNKYTPVVPTFFSPLFSTFGGGGASLSILWLLSNSVDLSASVGADGVMTVGDDTIARVYDETEGLVLATIPAGVPVPEGMRLVDVGAELIDNPNDAANWTQRTGTPTIEQDGEYVKITGTDAGQGVGLLLNSVEVDSLLESPNTTSTYRLVYEAYVSAGASVNISLAVTSPNGLNIITNETPQQFTVDAVHFGARFTQITPYSIDAGEILWIKVISFKEVLAIPYFVNDDGAANKLTPSKAGSSGEEIMLVHAARQNDEVILTSEYRVTATSAPHSFYYQNTLARNPDLIQADRSASNWTPIQGTIVDDGTALKATYDTGAYMAAAALSGTGILIVPFANLTTYVFTFKAKVSVGGQATVTLDPDATVVQEVITNTEYQDFTMEFTTGPSAITSVLKLDEATVGTSLWIDDLVISLAHVAGASEPPRDSLGRFYEESVVNGGFDADTDWTKGFAWSIAGGVATHGAPSLVSSITQPNVLEEGKRYSVYYEVTGNTNNGDVWARANWTAGQVFTDTAVNVSEIIVAGSGVTSGAEIRVDANFNGSIDNVSFVEVDANGNPTNITDGDVVWAYGGKYNNIGAGHLTHVLNEGERTNLFLNSEAPVTQDITTIAQDYTVSVWGTGSVTLSGAATGVATQGSPLTVTAAAGTLTCTVAGSLDVVQVEAADENTSFISTVGAPVERARTLFTAINPLPANDFAMRFRATLKLDGSSRLFYAGSAVEDLLTAYVAPDGKLHLDKKNAPATWAQAQSAAGVIPDSTPVLIGLLHDSTNGFKMFADGVEVLSNASTSDLVFTTTEFLIGHDEVGDAATLFGGVVDLAVATGPGLEAWASDITWADPA